MNIKENTVYKLGSHRLACGDCRDNDLVKKLIGRDKIKLIVADPPYGVSYVESKFGFGKIRMSNKVIENDRFKSEDDYKHFTSDWLEAAKPYLAAKNSLYIFNSDKMIFALKEALSDAGFKLGQLLVWIKNQAVIGRMDYLAKHELIAYGWYGAHAFFKSKDAKCIILS